MKYPVTIPEWEAYIDTLDREALWSQCRAVNTFTFAKTLITEGMSMDELETVVRLFARRMVQTEIKLPEGGAFDLHKLTEKDLLSAF